MCRFLMKFIQPLSSMNRSSNEVNDLVRRSDLIISKGGGFHRSEGGWPRP